MKNVAILVIGALVAAATADVQLFADNDCGANDHLIQTDAGHCYPVPKGTGSAKGCSDGHNLRVYAAGDCNGVYNERAPQKCASIGGAIGSVLCIN